MNIGVILAAGASERFQSKVHKQYLKLNGKEVIYYSISAMQEAKCFDKIIAVVDEEEYKSGYIANKYNVLCIPGGVTRNCSIKNALDYIRENFSADRVLFHDCARPIIKGSTFSKFISLLEDYNGISMCTPIVDSLVTTKGDFVNRKDYYLIRTPEAFDFNTLYQDFDETKADTAIINQLKERSKIHLFQNNQFDFKITYPEDLFLAEQLMRINYVHTYQHKTAPMGIGRVLLLGGSGGVGQAISNYLDKNGIEYYAPTHKELDLFYLSVQDIIETCPFEPDVIINVAAAYANDESGLIETFDKIFDVNLKSNLVLIEYAKTLKKPVNIVVMSSSSSTKGRENLTNYSAAKAALNSIVESQGIILAKQEIYLNAIIPEKINTPLIQKLHKTKINTRELLDAEEVIGAVMAYAAIKEGGKLVHVRKGL